MKVKILVPLLVFATTVAGLSAAYVLLGDEDAAVVNGVSDSSTQLSQDTQQSQPTAQNSQSRLQVGQNYSSQQPPQLPSSDQFFVYEEYADQSSALYIDATIGSGREVVSGDTVAVLYSGYLTNGELFDQSRPNENNELQPFIFTIGSGQVIPGWDQTIAGMKVGGARRLIIPSQFGYGPAGQGSIPPDSMLIFDVELLAIDGEQ
jgi:FKBP-type peptidyl-prolyl cis-trans isomerase